VAVISNLSLVVAAAAVAAAAAAESALGKLMSRPLLSRGGIGVGLSVPVVSVGLGGMLRVAAFPACECTHST
jgi:hypothetical protein